MNTYRNIASAGLLLVMLHVSAEASATCRDQVKACGAVERGLVLQCMADFMTNDQAPSSCFAQASDSLYKACIAIDTNRECSIDSDGSEIEQTYILPSKTTWNGYKGTTGTTSVVKCDGTRARIEELTITWGRGSGNKPARLLNVGFLCSDGVRKSVSSERGGGRAAVNGDNSDLTYSRTQSFQCNTGQLLSQVRSTRYDAQANNSTKSFGGGCAKVDPTAAWLVVKSREHGVDSNGASTAGFGGVAQNFSCPANAFVKGFNFYHDNVEWDDVVSTTHNAILGFQIICAKHVDTPAL